MSATAAAGSGRKGTTRTRIRVMQVLLVLALLAVWQLAVSSGAVNTIALASPGTVGQELAHWASSGRLLTDIGDTLVVLLIGYVAGIVGGTALGIVMGLSPVVHRFFDPFVAFCNSLPRLVLIPVLVAWLGFGRPAQVVLVFLLIVFMVVINVHASIADVPPEVIENGRMLGAGRWQLVSSVYLPAIGIWVITSARIAVGLGFQAAVVSEFFGSSHGLGYTLAQGQQQLDSGVIYAAVVVTALLAVGFDLLLGLVNRRISRWMPS